MTTKLLILGTALALTVTDARSIAGQNQDRATRGRWQLSVANPLIGMERPPKGYRSKGPTIWNDPSVLMEGDGYSMWASAGHGGPQGVAIYKLRSTNGQDWQVENDGKPVLEPGGKQDFDSLGVETPAVIKVGAIYHMYYSAYPHGKVPLVTMAHAVSPDGVHWKKQGELTSLTKVVGTDTGNPWGRLGRGEPAPLYYRDTFYLYFTDVRCRADNCKGSPAVIRGISLATSKDGQNFEQHGSEPVLLQTPSYPPSAGWEGYSTPWALVNNGRFELFCDVFRSMGKQSIQTAITHLRSDDGIQFQEMEEDVVASGREAWAGVSVRSPTVVVSDGVMRMWYAGDNYDPSTNKAKGSRLDAGIGVATDATSRLPDR